MESKKTKHLALFIKTSYPDIINIKDELISYLLRLPFNARLQLCLELIDIEGPCSKIPFLLHDFPDKHDFPAVEVSSIIHAITESPEAKLDKETSEFISRLIYGCQDNPESIIIELISFSPVASNFRVFACKDSNISKSLEVKLKESREYFFNDKWLLGDVDRFFIYNDALLSLFNSYLDRLRDPFPDKLLIKLIRNGRLVNTSHNAPSYADAFIAREGVDSLVNKISDVILKESHLCPESTPSLIIKFRDTSLLPNLIMHASRNQKKAIALMMIPYLSEQEHFKELTPLFVDNTTDLLISVSKDDFIPLIDIIEKSAPESGFIMDYLKVSARVRCGDEDVGRFVAEYLKDTSINFQYPDTLSDSYFKLMLVLQRMSAEDIAAISPDLCGQATKNLIIINPSITSKQCSALFRKSRHQLISRDMGL